MILFENTLYNKKEHMQNAYVLFDCVSCCYPYSYGKP